MKKQVGGVLATILSGVVIYWLTTGIDKAQTPNEDSTVATPLPPSNNSKQISQSTISTALTAVSAKESSQVVITAPLDDSVVDVIETISGYVTNKNASVLVIIQPLETQDCWAQKPVIVSNDGTWRASVQFGENTSAHSGKSYEVRAFANPYTAIDPGKTVCWPEADAISHPLYLKRQ